MIAGLERDEAQRHSGAVFERLLEQVAGILGYSEQQLEQIQCARAPLPVVSERELAVQLGVERSAGRFFWKPGDLRRLENVVPRGQCEFEGEFGRNLYR